MCENNNEDLRFNIERANEIVRLAENRRYKFLEINLALVTAFSFLFVYILEAFNDAGKASITFSIVIYFAYTCWNIGYNLKENRTTRIKKVLCSSREWKHQDFIKKIKEMKKNQFRRDYKIQLINLHKYQRNYNKIGRKTRIYTFVGLIHFLTNFVISILVNALSQCTQLEPFIIGVMIALYAISSIIFIIWLIILLIAEKKRESVAILGVEVPKDEIEEFKQVIKEYRKTNNKEWFF